MKLSEQAIESIDRQAVRLQLAIALNLTEQSIIRLIKSNPVNSPLTLAASLVVIRNQTGLSDKQILIPAAKTTITAPIAANTR